MVAKRRDANDCCECGDTKNDVRQVQMRIPGTAGSFNSKDRRYVCKACRKKRGYRGEFRILWR